MLTTTALRKARQGLANRSKTYTSVRFSVSAFLEMKGSAVDGLPSLFDPEATCNTVAEVEGRTRARKSHLIEP